MLRKGGSFARFDENNGPALQRSILEILLRDSLFYFIVYEAILTFFFGSSQFMALFYRMFATYLTTTLIWIFGSVSNGDACIPL